MHRTSKRIRYRYGNVIVYIIKHKKYSINSNTDISVLKFYSQPFQVIVSNLHQHITESNNKWMNLPCFKP